MCTEQNAIILNCRVIRAPLPDDDDMARAELEDEVCCGVWTTCVHITGIFLTMPLLLQLHGLTEFVCCSSNCGIITTVIPSPTSETISQPASQLAEAAPACRRTDRGGDRSLVEIVISLRKWFTLESSPSSADQTRTDQTSWAMGRTISAADTILLCYGDEKLCGGWIIPGRNCNNWRQIVINKIINFRARAFSAHPGKDLSEEQRRRSAAISIYLMSTDIIRTWMAGGEENRFRNHKP